MSTRHDGFPKAGSAIGFTVLLALLAGPGHAGSPPQDATPGRITQSGQDIEHATRQLRQRLAAGVADPVREAQAAAASGDFGFVASGGREAWPVGVVCRTPFQRGVSTRAYMLWGDAFDAERMKAMQAYEGYATAYNRTIIDHPLFKAADLCAPASPATVGSGVTGLELLGTPARRLARAPLSLHEAARRGSLADVRAFLARHEPDERDAFNMTALAWAVAYGRDDIAAALIGAGAQSMPEAADWSDVTPVLAAISQRRLGLLKRLQAPQPYPELYVETAIRSGDPAIVREVLGAPHEPLRHGWTISLSPSIEVANLIIDREGRAAADDLLLAGAEAGRPDLVEAALRKGADVRYIAISGETPLGVALEGYGPGILPTVKLLLAAGSDVNERPRPGRGYETPFWKAYRRVSYGRGGAEAAELFDRLVKAGGNASVPMKPGVPSVWTVVFPPRGDLTEIIAPAPDILATLKKAGMDLNVPYQGQCVLDAVEKLTGPEGEVAKSLKSLGAKRFSATGSCAM